MSPQIKWFILFVIAGVVIVIILNRYMPERADTIYINSRIYTMDANNTIAEAMAITNDKIVGIGTKKYIERKFRAKNIIDLDRKVVLPGLIDAHCHLLELGLARMTVELVGVHSEIEAAEKVAQRVAVSKPEQWIRGSGWNQDEWQTKSFPNKLILDRIAPNNPVYLVRIDGHACWVNKCVLEIAGINRQTTDPPGGKILRDANGEPTGIFINAAMDLINKFVPEPNEQEMLEAIRLATEECASVGITSVQEMGVDAKQVEFYKKMIDENKFPLRVYAAIDAPGELWDKMKSEGKLIGYRDNKLTIRALKLYVDGELGPHGAAMIEPYSDDPNNRGLTMFSEEELQKIVNESLNYGFQVCAHAIGDRANHIILNVYESVLKKHQLPFARLRVEHAQVLSPEDIPRFKQLDVLPSMQPLDCNSDMYWVESLLGPKRIHGAYAWRSLLNTGVVIPAGSDFPLGSTNLFFVIYAACTRQDRNAVPKNVGDVRKYFQSSANEYSDTAEFVNGWYNSEKMTREEAVRGFTTWAAYAAFEEKLKGSLERGKLADFIVISKDIFLCPAIEIPDIKVESTVLGGKVIFAHL